MGDVKVGSTYFTQGQLEKHWLRGKRYLVTYSNIYVIEYSSASQMLGARKIYGSPNTSVHFTKRGGSKFVDEIDVNNIVGHKLLNENNL